MIRVGPLLVGAAVGGLVWVFALRAANAAQSTPGGPPPPPDPTPTTVRDGQGEIVASGEVGAIAAPNAGTGELATTAAAARDTDTVNLAAGAHVAGVDGNTGTVVPFKTDPINGTITPDVDHPAGGQGIEQQSPTPARTTDPEPPPTYASGAPQYEDYIKARYGTTNGMTSAQIAEVIKEAARTGGLTL